MKAVVDNDILFKGACYGLLSDLVDAIPAAPNTVGVLGAARYVVRSKIKRQKLNGSLEAAQEVLAKFIAQAQQLEPSLAEQQLAAELEYQAQQANVRLDTGESQLCAALITRALPNLVTGDKNAVMALENLLDADPRLQPLLGKIVCLEQLVVRVIEQGKLASLRASVCAEPKVDRALSNCFSCASPDIDQKESYLEGLQSYIRDLRRSAGRVLAE